MSRRSKVAIVILAVILMVVVAVVFFAGRLPSNAVLVLHLRGPIEDQRPSGIFGELGMPGVLVQHQLLDALEAAKTDGRIRGLVLNIESVGAGWARTQELRRKLLEFRDSGKPSVCFLNMDAASNQAYYLATGCEQVWTVPTAPLAILGMMTESLFFRGTLDKLGIYPDLYHIAEYKTAQNQYVEKKYTPAHREMSESLVRSIYEQYLQEVGQSRGMTTAEFRALVEQGPHLSGAALEKKLVDRTAYWDEVKEYFKEKVGTWEPVGLKQYVKQLSDKGQYTVAVVHATGMIVVGDSDYDPFMGWVMGSNSVASDLRKACDEAAVRAVVFRVDSGGGSAVASEIIRREVAQCREKGKPIVVSMSDVAGSGGYWISMSADKIVAEPTTLTASIGVVYGKMNISGLFRLLGLSTDFVALSENATLLYEQQNFTPQQRQIIARLMRDIYDNFLAGVAQGRKMEVAAVERIAKGRVWTGAQAKELGLVDELGGYDRAFALARKLANLPADARLRVVRYPRPKTLFQVLLEGPAVLEPLTARADVASRMRRILQLTEGVQAQMPLSIRIR